MAFIEHLPTPDSLSVETVFGPVGKGTFSATLKILEKLASRRHGMPTTGARSERRKAKDAIDTRLASRLAGQWSGYDGAMQLLHAVHARGTEPPKSDRGFVNARLAVATLEGRLNYLLLTGGVSSRSAIGLSVVAAAMIPAID